ncbi:TonB-dependent receptor [Caulobacter sp. SSI4214]|uniref:TonB-dependent receptor n=1 Tax=Caulobacter sp. SSI4214 TaxID=2575739 RepID=UPI00143C25CF|nr:TonB-dependent receptor [Caulobacter sp. SSI4214]
MHRGLKTALIAGAAAMALTSAAWAQTTTFNVPAGEMATALDAFARASGAPLIYRPQDVTGLKTAGLKGSYTPEDGLRRLAEAAGLAVTKDRSGALVVSRPQAQTAVVATAAEPEAVSEIVVTGSNIRGLKNPTSPVLVFDRGAIAATGASTVQDFMRTLPQNFIGGPSGASQDGVLGSGALRNTNNEAASGVNLRGLGNKATLVLLDGHRMAPSAFGAFVDISAVPLAAVDRIDVLTDGASSIYGADAVGGVVNLILRKDYKGAETSARIGSVTNGGLRQQTISQLAGTSWSGGAAMANLQYEHQHRLSVTERSFTQASPSPTDIMPTYQKLTAIVSAHQDLTDRVTVYGDVLAGQNLQWRQITFGPTSRDINKARIEDTNVHAGVRAAFGAWRGDLSGTLSKQVLWKRNSVLTPPRVGYTLGEVSIKNAQDVRSVDLNFDGPLFDLPAGTVRLAVGAGYRKEAFRSLLPYSTVPTSRLRTMDRTVRAIYAELAAPLVGDANALPFVRSLDLSAAIRYDRYSAFGGTTNPKIGLRWEPAAGLAVRGAWGTSFRAPAADEVLNQGSGLLLASFPFTNPNGPGTIPIFIEQGQSADLGPETADTLSLGLDYQSQRLPGARLQFNYYDVDYRNRIVTPPFDTTALLHPSTYGALISTFASDAEAIAYWKAREADGLRLYDYGGTTGAGVRYLYRASTLNAALVRQRGLDGSATYRFARGADAYDLGLNASCILKITSRLAKGSDPQDVLNNLGEPNRLRLQGNLRWSRGGLWVNGLINHVGAYHNSFVIPTERVKAWTTADLVIGFKPDADRNALMHGLSVTLSATNLFDREPPYVNASSVMTTGVHYDAANADPRGRYVSLELRKSW